RRQRQQHPLNPALVRQPRQHPCIRRQPPIQRRANGKSILRNLFPRNLVIIPPQPHFPNHIPIQSQIRRRSLSRQITLSRLAHGHLPSAEAEHHARHQQSRPHREFQSPVLHLLSASDAPLRENRFLKVSRRGTKAQRKCDPDSRILPPIPALQSPYSLRPSVSPSLRRCLHDPCPSPFPPPPRHRRIRRQRPNPPRTHHRRPEQPQKLPRHDQNDEALPRRHQTLRRGRRHHRP